MDFYEAQLQARKITEQTGLTMAEIASLPLPELARLSGRPTPAEAAIAAFKAQRAQVQPQASAASQSAPQPPESAPQGRPLEELALTDDAAFRQWRAQRASGGENKGIFDSVGSQSGEYRAAARRQSGRTGWVNSNVVEPPRIEGRYLRHDDRIDQRSAAERFSNQATMWQGR